MSAYENTLIISDLDGTLIPRGGVISEENKEALQRFVAGGGRFAIATGRTPEAAAFDAPGESLTWSQTADGARRAGHRGQSPPHGP